MRPPALGVNPLVETCHQLCLDLRVGRPRSDRWPRAGAQHRGALVQAGDGGGRGGARAAHGLRRRGDAARAGLGRRGRAAGGGGGAVLPLRGAVRRPARGLPHARRLRVNEPREGARRARVGTRLGRWQNARARLAARSKVYMTFSTVMLNTQVMLSVHQREVNREAS